MHAFPLGATNTNCVLIRTTQIYSITEYFLNYNQFFLSIANTFQLLSFLHLVYYKYA